MTTKARPTNNEIVVDTVADLAVLNSTGQPKPVDGQRVRTTGWHAVNDGGGNLYDYIAADASPVDGGFVLDGLGGDNTIATLGAVTTTPGTGVGRYVAVDTTLANIRQFGAIGDSSLDDTLRIQSAIDSMSAIWTTGLSLEPTVYIPQGVYLVTDTITTSVCSIFGHGLRTCRIKFQSTASVPCISINEGAPTIQLTGVNISNLWISIVDNAFDKTGIRIEDTSVAHLHDLDISFASAPAVAQDSVGIHILGRESLSCSNLRIFCPVPIRFSRSPLGVAGDNFSFTDCYLSSNGETSTLVRAICLIDPNVIVSWLEFSGHQAWAKGDHAIYHVGDASIGAGNASIRVGNVRFEQGTDYTKHAFHFDYTGSTSFLSALILTNCRVQGSKSGGIYARKIDQLDVRAFVRDDSAGNPSNPGQILNIENCSSVNMQHMAIAGPLGGSGTQDFNMGNLICTNANSSPTQAYDKFPKNSSWVTNWSDEVGSASQPFYFEENLHRLNRVTRINDGATETLSLTGANGFLFGRLTLTVVGVLAGSTTGEGGTFIGARRPLTLGTRGYSLVSGTPRVSDILTTANSINLHANTSLATVSIENNLGEDVYVIVESAFVHDGTNPVQSRFEPAGP